MIARQTCSRGCGIRISLRIVLLILRSFGQVLLKQLEAVVPEPFVLRDPVPHRAELFRDELVAAFAAVPLLGQETGIEQDAEVLRRPGGSSGNVPQAR